MVNPIRSPDSGLAYFQLATLQRVGDHVEAGIDPFIELEEEANPERSSRT